MSIAHFKEQIMMRGGPKQFAQSVLNAVRGRDDLTVDTLYGTGENTLMRMEPPSDSMDWVRDCLGVDFDGPTAWDRYMNLHKWDTKPVPNLDGAPRRGYRGWLLDSLSTNSDNSVVSKNFLISLKYKFGFSKKAQCDTPSYSNNCADSIMKISSTVQDCSVFVVEDNEHALVPKHA